MDRGRERRVADLLVDNIHDELASASAGFGLGLDEPTLEQLARGVAANVLYAFAVDWSPDWIKPGGIHAWESAGEWFARCSVCLEDSPPMLDRENAIGWAVDHTAGHHASP